MKEKPIITDYELVKTLYRSKHYRCRPDLHVTMEVEVYDLLCKKAIELNTTRCELARLALTYAVLIPGFWVMCEKVQKQDAEERKRYLDQSKDGGRKGYKGKGLGRPKGSKSGLTPQG